MELLHYVWLSLYLLTVADKAQVAKLIEVLGSLSIDLPEETDDLRSELDDLLDDEPLDADSDEEGFSNAKSLRNSGKKQSLKNSKNQEQFSHPLLREIQVSTVDAFQGAEKGTSIAQQRLTIRYHYFGLFSYNRTWLQ